MYIYEYKYKHCQICGSDKGRKNKWCDTCKSTLLVKLRYLKRKEKQNARTWECIEYKGGKCNRCGKSDLVRSAFEFHHVGDKDAMISAIVHYGPNWWNIAKEELDKCELLCSNCHGIEHYNDTVGYVCNKRRKFIQQFIDYLGGACYYCGGVYHPAAYDFHHRNPETKVDTISNFLRGKQSLADVWKELDKCDLVCSNCHKQHHEVLYTLGLDYFDFNTVAWVGGANA